MELHDTFADIIEMRTLIVNVLSPENWQFDDSDIYCANLKTVEFVVTLSDKRENANNFITPEHHVNLFCCISDIFLFSFMFESMITLTFKETNYKSMCMASTPVVLI